MGRQVAVAMTEVDEAAFLRFVRETADVQIFGSQTPTEDALRCDAFGESFQYFLWNKAFPFSPEVRRSAVGTYYISNLGSAPVVEYDRHNFEHPLNYGRLYWAKGFSAPNGLSYDVEKFEAWYDSLVCWVKKNGKRKSKGTLVPYSLPDAWARFGSSS